jgi:hypothetical protein
VLNRSSSSGSKVSSGRPLALVARDDLGFGLHVQLAQLFAQAGGGGAEFAKVGAERTELLLEAGAVDGDFTGVVDQAVEQVGADAHLFLRRANAAALLVFAQASSADSGEPIFGAGAG